MRKMLLLHQAKEKCCKEQAFKYLLPKGKFGYNAPRDIQITPAWYFNQRLLNFNQYFASDADYVFFARSMYEQHHLSSLITFSMQKINPDTLIAETIKNNFKETV